MCMFIFLIILVPAIQGIKIIIYLLYVNSDKPIILYKTMKKVMNVGIGGSSFCY